MIRCNKCGYVGSYYGPKCPSCKEAFNLTAEEIHEKMKENITGKSFLLRKRRKYEVKERLKNESSFPPE